jgi:hypothetical protein
VGYGNQEFWIENIRIPTEDIFRSDWIHVMNKDAIINFESRYAKVVAEVPTDDFITSPLPFLGFVESLIEMTLISERRFTYYALDAEVIKPLYEGI